MRTILDILLIFGGLIILIFAAEMFVKSTTNLSYKFRISPFIIGFTVAAFGSSLPELAVNVSASLTGHDELAIGSVIGSAITNSTLMLGLTAIIFPVVVSDCTLKIELNLAIGSCLLLVFFLSRDYEMSRFEGIISVLIQFIYMYFLIKIAQKEEPATSKIEIPYISKLMFYKELALFFGSIGLLLIGSKYMFVVGASSLVKELEISERIVGLTIVALGTSLPELITCGMAAYHKKTSLIMGTLLGANIFGVFFILGITSILHPIHDTSHHVVNHDLWWLLGVNVLFLPLLYFTKIIGRTLGVFLIALYVVYITWAILHESFHFLEYIQ